MPWLVEMEATQLVYIFTSYVVLVGIFSPFVALKRKKMNNFNISLFFVTSFDFRPFQTDNNRLVRGFTLEEVARRF